MVGHLRIIAVAVAILVLAFAAAVWVGAVERWISQELRALAAARPARPRLKLSDRFQVRAVSIQDGRVQFDPRDGSAATALIHGITRKLLLQPGDAGAYGIEFSLDRDRARIKNLRMNSRWYGLRGHGDVSFDSRLDLMAEGGPVQRVENEFSAAGDVLGEITETLLRAHVTGTLGEPTVGIEALRHPLR